MYKIAVMGDRDSIYGFAAVGLQPFPITDTEEAAAKLKSLVDGDYAVIYITAVSYTHLDVYKRQSMDLHICSLHMTFQ